MADEYDDDTQLVIETEQFELDNDEIDKEIHEKESDESDDDDDDDVADLVASLPGQRKRKRGRKSPWEEDVIDDLVDCVCSSETLTRKLIYENTKKSSNKLLYEELLNELKRRLQDRGAKEISFTVDQARTRFKKCISLAKEAALTVRNASGIKRFKDQKGFGRWFMQLYPIVKARDSCQADQGIEPGFDNPSTFSMDQDDGTDDEEENTEKIDPSKVRQAKKTEEEASGPLE